MFEFELSNAEFYCVLGIFIVIVVVPSVYSWIHNGQSSPDTPLYTWEPYTISYIDYDHESESQSDSEAYYQQQHFLMHNLHGNNHRRQKKKNKRKKKTKRKKKNNKRNVPTNISFSTHLKPHPPTIVKNKKTSNQI